MNDSSLYFESAQSPHLILRNSVFLSVFLYEWINGNYSLLPQVSLCKDTQLLHGFNECLVLTPCRKFTDNHRTIPFVQREHLKNCVTMQWEIYHFETPGSGGWGGVGSAHVQLATNLSQDIEVLFDVKCLFLILLLFSMVLFLMISPDSTFASYVTVVSTTLMLLTNIIS